MNIRNNADGTVTLTEGDYIATTREPRTCNYCGKSELEEGVGEVAIHSNQQECWPCWNWRKLDGPAASHWKPVFDKFFSNVDYHDVSSFFPKMLDLGDEDTAKLFELMRKVQTELDHALALRENYSRDRRAAREASKS